MTDHPEQDQFNEEMRIAAESERRKAHQTHEKAEAKRMIAQEGTGERRNGT